MTDPSLGRPGEQIAGKYLLDVHETDRGAGEPWSATVIARPSERVLMKLLPGGARGAPSWSSVAETLRRLGNPLLPGVRDAGELADGRRWIALEPVEGRSLDAWLRAHEAARTAPGVGEVVKLFEAIARAVQVGHQAPSNPVLHRGLSPRSVIVRTQQKVRHVKLLDHEVARFLGAHPVWSYAAPEQLEGVGRETAATDVFALGVLVTELLTLRAAPPSSGRETWAGLVLREPKRWKALLPSLRDDVPSKLWAALAGALEPDPSKRWPNAQEFARRWMQAIPDAWRTAPPFEADPVAPVGSSAGASVSSSRREAESVPDGWQHAERASWIPPEATPMLPSRDLRRAPVVAPPAAPVRVPDAGVATLVDEGIDHTVREELAPPQVGRWAPPTVRITASASATLVDEEPADHDDVEEDHDDVEEGRARAMTTPHLKAVRGPAPPAEAAPLAETAPTWTAGGLMEWPEEMPPGDTLPLSGNSRGFGTGTLGLDDGFDAAAAQRLAAQQTLPPNRVGRMVGAQGTVSARPIAPVGVPPKTLVLPPEALRSEQASGSVDARAVAPVPRGSSAPPAPAEADDTPNTVVLAVAAVGAVLILVALFLLRRA